MIKTVKANSISKLSKVSYQALILGLGSLCAPHIAHASSDEPSGLNLGTTSFMDAYGRVDPGFSYVQYFIVSQFSGIHNTAQQDVSAFKNPDISAIASLNQIAYTSPYHVLGGAIGGIVAIPIVLLNSSFASNSPAKLQANQGLTIGNFVGGLDLQMFPKTLPFGIRYNQRFEFDFIAPTGAYNPHKDLNAGTNFWSINPYYTITVLPTQKTEFSGRFYYLHNFENHDAASSNAAVSGTTFTAGDAGWVNFTASYVVRPGLNVGINGYYFKQFTDDTAEGLVKKGTETENVTMGPGARYVFNKTNIFYANLYLPIIKKNTTYGVSADFRWIHRF